MSVQGRAGTALPLISSRWAATSATVVGRRTDSGSVTGQSIMTGGGAAAVDVRIRSISSVKYQAKSSTVRRDDDLVSELYYRPSAVVGYRL